MRPFALLLCSAAVSGCLAHQPASIAAEAPVEVAAKGAATAVAPSSARADSDFHDWLGQMRVQARAEGVSADTLDEALDPAAYLPEVIERDRAQPEFTRQIWEYLDTAVSDARIRNGRTQWDAHREAAAKASARYGIAPEILIAIWGMESNYGSHFGNFRTIDALATLGFDGRRSRFAQRELLAALKIIDDGDIDRDRMRGSWAGAMGHTQFLPSSFRAYAVDGDGDGRRDIWGSIPDVMASTAHYLDRAGWVEGEPWGAEVRLPSDFDYSLSGRDQRKPVAAWAQLGVRATDGDPLPALSGAALLLPAGAKGPAFLVGRNFDAILRYNNATSYALGVGLLADRVAGRPGLQAAWPRGLSALTRREVKEMQTLLNRLGFDVGTPDGIVGPNTRSGLRAFQRQIGETPDAFPTAALLAALRARADG
ncbi:lytic murein transglycosylase [Algiphilus sp.]|uniref:lytic murein transglycosylase n=1 Tax=Algiphilus sp. TaxID=1872431 RepID=UPI003BA89EDA